MNTLSDDQRPRRGLSTTAHEKALRAVSGMGGVPLSSYDVHEMTGLKHLHAHAVLLDLSERGLVQEIPGPFNTPLFVLGRPL